MMRMEEEPRRHSESEPESDQETTHTSHASEHNENAENAENDGNTSFDNVYSPYNKPGLRGRPVGPHLGTSLTIGTSRNGSHTKFCI